MLTPEEIREIEEDASRMPLRRSASIEALRVVQRHRGWVSDEALRDVALLLGMSAADLDSVATFYSLIYRKPVGRHVILMCDSVSCWILGYERLAAWFAEHLRVGFGETTADGRFTLLPAACLGACERAPVLMIGNDLHTEVAPEQLERILAEYP